MRLRHVVSPLLCWIKDSDVSACACGQSPASLQSHDARRISGEQLDDAGERYLMAIMQDRDTQAQRGFQPGHAEGRAIKLLIFFMLSMRSVVGSHTVHGSIHQA